MGNKYEVGNFGFNGRTMLNKGDYPYMQEQMYKDVLNFMPNIVIIKLGTNDSKPQNWKHEKEYPVDMQRMIDDLNQLSSEPKIYLCYPTKAHKDIWGIRDNIIENEVISYIDYVAEKNDLQVIDIYSVTSNMEQNFPDKIHPNEEGMKTIAEMIYFKISIF